MAHYSPRACDRKDGSDQQVRPGCVVTGLRRDHRSWRVPTAGEPEQGTFSD
jgi:hypothetical protein